MARLAFIGDLHIADFSAATRDDRDARESFVTGIGPVDVVFRHVNESGVDHAFFLGDLVDWFSEANTRLALDHLSTLTMPWSHAPGNHDYEQAPSEGYGLDVEASRAWWATQDLPLRDHVVEFSGVRVLVVDSALSRVGDGVPAWTRDEVRAGKRNILATHVPINTPAVVDYIVARDPGRGLEKYVQSGSPDYFEAAIKGHISEVFTGHLHFAGEVASGGTAFHLIPLGARRDAAGAFPGVRIIET